MARSKKNQMHPRNLLRSPPDYTKLAIKYKDFRNVCALELTGKVTVNFRQERTLRELTKVLLKEYFQLDVDFAPGSLVPTLALRLNYILWLEDLLEARKVKSKVRGIDIGCGSSCIYSLLAAKKNQWEMLALESKPQNIEYARENVKRNQLDDLIEVYAQPDKTNIFKTYFDSAMDEQVYCFCLCNPPFFDSSSANPMGGASRNPERRPAPNNARTGSAEELSCVGGEVQFVQRIIEESEIYKERISIFTSMLGVKANVPKILVILKERGIEHVATTEFHQGHTTRWAIAWSYQQFA